MEAARLIAGLLRLLILALAATPLRCCKSWQAMSFLSDVRSARECYRIEMPGEEHMSNSPRLSHYFDGLDES